MTRSRAALRPVGDSGEGAGPGQSASSVDALDIKLGFLIHDVSRLRRAAFDQLMGPLGVTRSQWWVIAHLARNNGMIQTELAMLLDVGKVSLGCLVDRLEAGGWVERRPDPHDRRLKRVFLTDEANGLVVKMQTAEHALNRDVLKGLSASERSVLAEVLGRVRHNLDDVVGKRRESTEAA